MELPVSKSETLAAFIGAVRSRSRALKNQFRVVSCEHTADGEPPLEGVTLLLSGGRRDSLRLTLQMREDRWCRFDARKATKVG